MKTTTRWTISIIMLVLIFSACQTGEPTTSVPPTNPPLPTEPPPPTQEPGPEPTETDTPLPEPTEVPTEVPPPTETPILAPLGEEGNPIIWAMIRSQETGFDPALAQVVETMRDQTGLAVEALVMDSYSQIVDRMCAGEVHIATLDAFAYIWASERGCADAELSTIRAGSGSVYESQILVRFDSDINTYDDMRGKILCRASTSSKSGWIVPNLKLRAEGIDPENDFAEIIDVAHHDDVIAGIYNGDCHVGATYVDARVLFANQHADVRNVVHVFVQTIQIPFESISFIPDISLEMRTALTEAFWFIEGLNAGQLIMDMSAWDGLLERHDYLYDPMRELIEASGVPVETLVP